MVKGDHWPWLYSSKACSCSLHTVAGWSIGRSPAMYMYGQPAASQPASRPGPYRSSCSYMLMHACNAAMRATASSWLQPCMYTALASAPSEALSYMYYMCYMAVLAPTKYTAISLSLSRSGLAGWLLLAGGHSVHHSSAWSACIAVSQAGYSHVLHGLTVAQPCTDIASDSLGAITAPVQETKSFPADRHPMAG